MATWQHGKHDNDNGQLLNFFLLCNFGCALENSQQILTLIVTMVRNQNEAEKKTEKIIK